MKTLSIISDFNVEPLKRLLSVTSGIECSSINFGQVYQFLYSESKKPSDIGVVWTLPENVIASFSKALHFEDFDIETCLIEVEKFADGLISYAQSFEFILVPCWSICFEDRGYGILDWKSNFGIKNVLAKMNIKLSECISKQNKVFMLDSQSWFFGSANVYSPKMFYAAKVPFTNLVFKNAALEIVRAIKTIRGNTKKLIVLDLDNTLWGGVVGENGWEGIILGGHDFKGEAFRDFQKNLKSLTRRGLMLAIVSKNDESVAVAALNKHPEMILKPDDFCGWRINWHDKAENIKSLVEELNIGLDSVVFIDDNPVERKRVSEAFPQVLVPDWPDDVTNYSSYLKSMDCFDSATFSSEDSSRTQMYIAQRERNQSIKSSSTKNDWLDSLKTQAKIAKVDKSNINRVTQLFNKTNQLNLSTRRLSEPQIVEWMNSEENNLITVSISDCFGDIGLVGIIGLRIVDCKGEFTDFILSCRAMGREVEKLMFYIGIEKLARLGATSITATFIKTDRNRPTLDVLSDLKFKQQDSNVYAIPINAKKLKPKYINID
jgi:FkbH-like protein